jgi:hypothetical protein
VYNSNRDKRLTEQELIERQKRRDSVSVSHQHKTRKREAAEQASWEQLELFVNGEDDEA